MSTIKAKENLAYDVQSDDLIPLVNNGGDTPQSVTPGQLLVPAIKPHEDGAYVVQSDDLIPLVNNAGLVAKSVTPLQLAIAAAINGDNYLTVGVNGRFATVAEAVAFINIQPRYVTVYDTGTCGMTKGAKAITPQGGADWSALSEAANSKQLYLRIETPDIIFIPLLGVTPNLTNAPTWGNYGELKYNYEGVTGNKTYSFVTPNWYHIQLLPGEIVDPVPVSYPLFTTIAGASKESTVWRGAFYFNCQDVGFFARDFTWGSINLVFSDSEESLFTVQGVTADEHGYAEVFTENIGGGQGNADRDVTYRVSLGNTHALFHSVKCDYYSQYDVTQCVARNLIFKLNNVYVQTQDTTVMTPTGFRWFSGTLANGLDLFIDMDGNNFFVEGSAGSRPAIGILLVDETASYLTTPPNVRGRVVNNHIQCRQLGTGSATGIQTPNALFSANNGRVFIDNNTFDVVSVGGTRIDILTHGSFSPLLLGQSNITMDGTPLSITGAPKRLENHGISAAIATGATIAHGLGAVPTGFNAMPNGPATDVYVTADATNLTVNFGGGGSHTFAWEVKL